MEVERSKPTEQQQNVVVVVSDREEHEKALLDLLLQMPAAMKLKQSKYKLALFRGQPSASTWSVESRHVNVDKSDASSKKYTQLKSHLNSQFIPVPPSPSFANSTPQGLQETSHRGIKRSHHKRRVRCIAVCPVNDRRFVTSALDGVVNLWEVYSSGSNAW
ncbi:hypothetical protein VNO78_10468 [Psophocarpus tetragonolobus]|uniref:Uncharacterized protein n=1 Tax=Psophocarpus tetragonolobus TaxID=3891 RepID=A0AAN9SLC3_PSOTE